MVHFSIKETEKQNILVVFNRSRKDVSLTEEKILEYIPRIKGNVEFIYVEYNEKVDEKLLRVAKNIPLIVISEPNISVGNHYIPHEDTAKLLYEHIEIFLNSYSIENVYVCGPPGFLEAVCGKKTSEGHQGEVEGILKEYKDKYRSVYKF